jgi:hypothetical protein
VAQVSGAIQVFLADVCDQCLPCVSPRPLRQDGPLHAHIAPLIAIAMLDLNTKCIPRAEITSKRMSSSFRELIARTLFLPFKRIPRTRTRGPCLHTEEEPERNMQLHCHHSFGRAGHLY